MKKDILKKFDSKKQLMVSPLALVISACGGGSTTNPETGNPKQEAGNVSEFEKQTLDVSHMFASRYLCH